MKEILNRETWSREEIDQAKELLTFINEHKSASALPADLLAALGRLRGILAGGFGGTTLEYVGYGWKSRITGQWSFRSGPRPERVPGPPPPPRSEFYRIVASPVEVPSTCPTCRGRGTVPDLTRRGVVNPKIPCPDCGGSGVSTTPTNDGSK